MSWFTVRPAWVVLIAMMAGAAGCDRGAGTGGRIGVPTAVSTEVTPLGPGADASRHAVSPPRETAVETADGRFVAVVEPSGTGLESTTSRIVIQGPSGDGREFVEEGVMPGRVLRAPQGDGGFGYDPLFRADDHGGADGNPLSTAELSSEAKDEISHRGKALAAISPVVAQHI